MTFSAKTFSLPENSTKLPVTQLEIPPAMPKTKARVGRPFVLEDVDLVSLASRNARTKLQSESERRALIHKVVDLGGRATVLELNEAFGYECRPTILALIRNNWLALEKGNTRSAA